MITLILFIQFSILLEMRFRLRGFTPQEAMSWFFFVSQIVYINGDLIYNSDYVSSGWETYSYVSYPSFQIYYYGGIVLLLYASTFGVSNATTASGTVFSEMRSLRERSQRFDNIFKAGVGVIIIVHLVLAKWDIVWYNHDYLLMNGPAGVKSTEAIGRGLMSLLSISGFISAFFLAQNLTNRQANIPIIWLMFFGWQMLFFFGASARIPFAMLAFFTVFYGFFSERRQPIVLTAFGVSTLFLLICALSGRGNGEFGISAVGTIFLTALGPRTNLLATVLGSVFQGIFITGDGNLYNPPIEDLYKILSFSPLPSFIDDFQSINYRSEPTLSPFVPMSGFSEILKFGPLYFIFFWGFNLLTFRTLLVRRKELGVFYFFASLILIFFNIQGQTYQLRSIFRQIFYIYLISIYISNRAKVRKDIHFK